LLPLCIAQGLPAWLKACLLRIQLLLLLLQILLCGLSEAALEFSQAALQGGQALAWQAVLGISTAVQQPVT
jgi:hypothetical protein